MIASCSNELLHIQCQPQNYNKLPCFLSDSHFNRKSSLFFAHPLLDCKYANLQGGHFYYFPCNLANSSRISRNEHLPLKEHLCWSLEIGTMKKNRTFAEKKRKHFGKEVPQSVSHDFPRSNDYFTVSHGFIISVVLSICFYQTYSPVTCSGNLQWNALKIHRFSGLPAKGLCLEKAGNLKHGVIGIWSWYQTCPFLMEEADLDMTSNLNTCQEPLVEKMNSEMLLNVVCHMMRRLVSGHSRSIMMSRVKKVFESGQRCYPLDWCKEKQ